MRRIWKWIRIHGGRDYVSDHWYWFIFLVRRDHSIDTVIGCWNIKFGCVIRKFDKRRVYDIFTIVQNIRCDHGCGDNREIILSVILDGFTIIATCIQPQPITSKTFTMWLIFCTMLIPVLLCTKFMKHYHGLVIKKSIFCIGWFIS